MPLDCVFVWAVSDRVVYGVGQGDLTALCLGECVCVVLLTLFIWSRSNFCYLDGSVTLFQSFILLLLYGVLPKHLTF